MKYFSCALVLVVVLGCGDETSSTSANDGGSVNQGGAGNVGGSSNVGGAGMGGAGGMGSVIPPCGATPSETFWLEDDALPHNTPALASQEGVVTQPVQYIEGTVDASTGAYFYVFCTGPQFTQFDMQLFSNTATIDFVHIHDGSGDVMGAEIPPTTMTSVEVQSWTLQPDHQYLLEISAPGGGFF